MSKEMKMADVWGFGNIPQDYTIFNGYKHDNGDWDDVCYGLLFLTEEAADAQAYALRNHDRLTEENAALREALRLKEAECEALAVDISSIVTYACDACLSGSEQQHVNNLYSAIQDASGKLYNDEPGCSNESQQAD